MEELERIFCQSSRTSQLVKILFKWGSLSYYKTFNIFFPPIWDRVVKKMCFCINYLESGAVSLLVLLNIVYTNIECINILN